MELSPDDRGALYFLAEDHPLNGNLGRGGLALLGIWVSLAVGLAQPVPAPAAKSGPESHPGSPPEAAPQPAAPRWFRWGTDPTGGAPFIYQDAQGRYIGFEVELAEYLARKMNRQSQLVEGTWANLPAQLEKSPDAEKGIDVVLNGYEFRADLAQKYAASRPYYAYRIALMTHREQTKIQDWKDLAGLGVGVLGGTVAHRHLLQNHADADILTNEDVANVIQLVQDRRLPATVQDSPAATHFLKEYPELRLAGEPIRAGYYVLYYRPTDVELGQELNDAIRAGLLDGSFRRIYEKYDLWNDDQAELIPLLDQPWPPPLEKDPVDWPRLLNQLFKAARMTVFLAVTSFPLAMLAGLLVALGRVYGPVWLAVLFKVYVEVIRGTPLLLQLYALYYMVPIVAEHLSPGASEWFSPIVCGIFGLAMNYSAYEAENYRAGLLAIPRGQMEAALSLGMTRLQAIRYVIAPQAVRIVIPPVTNDFIALFKDTSVCSVIMITELTRQYNTLYNFNRDIIVELVLITAGLYLLMSWPLGLLAGRLETRLSSQPGGRA